MTKKKSDRIERFNGLDARVREASKEYYHSRPVASYSLTDEEGKTHSVEVDLRALLLLSALTDNKVLLSGSTGCGKTHLAKMVNAALFGEKGYRTLQIDASFSLDKLRDITFKTIAEGGRLHDAVVEADVLNVPGVVIDEYNRAPPEITNIIQGWLQNGVLTFEGGKECRPGVVFNDGERYQWKIATVNEGSRYSGARKLDKASRDRLSVEIPLDVFPLTDDDRRKLRAKTSTGVEVYNGDGALEDVLAAVKDIRQVPLSAPAEEFLLYLQRMNQCVKTPNKTKLEVENFSPEYCKGCHLSKGQNNICGSVYAPSDRSIIALQNLARGFAFYRHVQIGSPLVADSEDVIAAAPFVLLSKLDIHPGWIDKKGEGSPNGSRWAAVTQVVKYAYERFAMFFKNNYKSLKSKTPDAENAIKKYAAENDAWAVELR